MQITSERTNKDFIIRCYPAIRGKGNNSLLSYNTLVEHIGPELAHKHIDKAYKRGLDKYTFKLRRGVKVELASK